MEVFIGNTSSVPEWKTGIKDILQLMDIEEVIKDLKIIKRDKRATAESKDQAISSIMETVKEWSDVLGLKNVTKQVIARYLGEGEKYTSIALVNECLKRWNVPASFQVEMANVFLNFAKTFVAAFNFLQTGTDPTRYLPIKYCMTESCQLQLSPDYVPVRGRSDVITALSNLEFNLLPRYDDTLVIDPQVDMCKIILSGTCSEGELTEFNLKLVYRPGSMASEIELQIERQQSMSNLRISEP